MDTRECGVQDFARIFYPRRVKILIGSFREIDFLKYLHLQTVNLRHFLECK